CCSDHVPYLNRGRPALLTNMNDFGDYNSLGHYHSHTDLPQNLTPAMAQAIVRMNVAVLAQRAGLTEQVFANGFD
ncbi:MAG: hypothetical protein ACREVG_16750, partial [Burkholderiales bacterium]